MVTDGVMHMVSQWGSKVFFWMSMGWGLSYHPSRMSVLVNQLSGQIRTGRDGGQEKCEGERMQREEKKEQEKREKGMRRMTREGRERERRKGLEES